MPWTTSFASRRSSCTTASRMRAWSGATSSRAMTAHRRRRGGGQSADRQHRRLARRGGDRPGRRQAPATARCDCSARARRPTRPMSPSLARQGSRSADGDRHPRKSRAQRAYRATSRGALALAGFHAVAPDFLSPLGGTPADEDEARDGDRQARPRPPSTAAAVAMLDELRDAQRRQRQGRRGRLLLGRRLRQPPRGRGGRASSTPASSITAPRPTRRKRRASRRRC